MSARKPKSKLRPGRPAPQLINGMATPEATPSRISSLSLSSEVPGPKLSGISQGIHSASNDGWKGFKRALEVLNKVSAVFPPLEGALGGLLKVVEFVDQASDNQHDFKATIRQIKDLSALIRGYKEEHIPRNILDRIDGLSQSIMRRTKFIEERMEKGTFRRILNSSDDANDVVSSLREMAFAVELFHIDTSMAIETQGRETLQIVNDMHERELLKILDAADGAPYIGSSRSGCMDGTRVDTLTRLLAWAADTNSPSICWLSGMAGIGKSAIAQSFCKMIDDGRLGGSFFCSRQAASLNKVNRILPTIAFQLAHRSRPYREAVIELLKHTTRGSYSLAALHEQARDLFIKPLSHLGALDEHILVIVIDALDECTSHSAVSDLLRVILRSDLPLKFLITGRPETHIDKGFSIEKRFEIDGTLTANLGFRPELLGHESLRLHDIEKDIVEDDITRYLTSKLSFIFEQIDEQNVQNGINALAKKSGKLFIFAFTAVQYISSGANSNLPTTEVQVRLSTVLNTPHGRPSTLATQNINNLYWNIFASAYSGKEKDEIRALRETLDTLLCLREPQSISTTATLLGKGRDVVRAHLGNFSSVLDIPEDNNTPVCIFHTSFADYITDSSRSEAYVLEANTQHQELGLACLILMNRLLHEDMCTIKIRQAHNADIDRSVIRERIPLALRYACVFWASHLAISANAGDVSMLVIKELEEFVDLHLLHWLECLSLVQELHVAFDCVQKARVYLSKDVLKGPKFRVREDMLVDVQHMIPQCYYFLKSHALEVYVSALVWLPTDSTLKAKYAQRRAPWVLQGLDPQWGACLQVLPIKDRANGLAYSPNGVNLANGSNSPIVTIWNLETGEVVKELIGHEDWVIPVVFSPDGSKIASGSTDKTVRVWNAETGEFIKPLLGHTERINSIIFSPDGLVLASGSDDTTVRIWNVETGELIKQLVGHTGWVSAMSFFPDGSKLVSGSADKTARIWNVETGVLDKALLGHSGWIRAIAVLPDGSMLASGSADNTIRLWGSDTGELVNVLRGHTGQVRSISISPNGSQLVSGSEDQTVRVWDPKTGKVLKELLGHTEWVNFVKYSPDGSKLASASADKTIRIWNVETSTLVSNLDGHTERVSSIAFSPDRSKLASGSDDKSVRIWNATSGELMKVLLGHTHWVTTVVFSPDGSKLVSGSDDETLRIWSVEAGTLIQKLVGHTDWIRSAAFSPDGSKLASGSNDRTVRIWEVETGELLKELVGHVHWVSSVLFSLDGCMLASGSFDNTVRIWNAETGEVVKELQNHTDQVGPVIFSQDGDKPNPIETFMLSDNQPCIVSQNAEGERRPQLWIWRDYFQSGICHSSFSQTRGCLGYETGRIIILTLSGE